MNEILHMSKEWWADFKKMIPEMKKPFVALFCIYLVGLSSILRANYNYMDDLGRTAWGYRIWDAFSRYITQFLAILVHSDTTINDISPLPQILAVCIIVASSLLLIKVFGGKFSLFSIAAVLPLGMSPFFLECFSYKFDSPYMALSIFASIFPLAFISSPPKLYYTVLALGTLVMLLTYQASSGIFIVCLVALMALQWNQGKDAKSCLRLILTSGLVQLVVCLLFKILLVKEYDNYVSTDMVYTKNMLTTIYNNIVMYFSTIWLSSTIAWRVMYIGVSLGAVRMFVMESKRNKAKASMIIIAVLLFCSVISYGAYIVLQRPLFAPRAVYGFGVLITVFGLIAVNGKTTNLMGKAACILLSWSLIVFSLAYGNALAEQKRYETFRVQMLLNDVSKIPGLDRHNVKKMQLKGGVGFSPVLQRMEKRYPILNYLVNVQLKAGYCFGEFYLFNYFPLPGIEQEPNWGRKRQVIDDSSMPIFMDTAYHTIKVDDKSIVVILKEEKIVYKSYHQV